LENNCKIYNLPSLSCTFFNARSLTNKTTLLSEYARSYKPTIIAITETWANPDIPDGIYSIQNYNLFRADRVDKRGGGVMIYILNSIPSSEISLVHSHEFEYICIRVSLTQDNCLGFLCVYRPPSTTCAGDMVLIDLIESFINLRNKSNIILGDFNMPHINWNTLSGPTKNEPFLNCLSRNFLKQNVRESTRPNSDSLLDLIFTTIGTNIHELCVDECFGTSDHSMISFKLPLHVHLTSTNPGSLKRNYNKANWDLLRKLLQDVDWDLIFCNNELNVVWQNFKTVLNNCIKASIPYKKRYPWQVKSSSKIRSALRYTRRCNSNYKTSQSTETLLKLVQAKLYLQELIDEQIDSYENCIIRSLRDNPKVYWSYVNSKLKRKQNSLESIKVGDRTIDDPIAIAETLNEYFYQSFSSVTSDLSTLRPNTESQPAPTIKNVDINLDVVNSVIRYLPNKRSEDHDGFSYNVIKEGGDILAFQLTRLFRLSFEYGRLPQDWKKSIIFPIKKRATSNTPDSFRPINVTSCFCRVLERILRNSLSKFLIKNRLINKSQHGFLYSRSTTTALLSYSNDLTYALDKGRCIDSAYFDFSKAFDSVRHDYLIKKLITVGISGNLIKWIIDYLTNRTQVVKIKNTMSSEKQVTSDDVDENIKNSTVIKYADDIRLYRSFNSDSKSQLEHNDLFQNDINALTSWSSIWALKFSRSNMNGKYKIDDSVLISKSKEKDLGILFSNKLTFDDHIDSIVKKANRQLGIITKIFKSRRASIIIPLYKTFVRPHLEYNSIIWSPHTKKNDKKIEKIQKRMLKLVNGSKSMTYVQKLKKHSLLSLQARRIKEQMTTVYKIKNNLMDLNFDDFFHMNKYTKTRGNVFKLLIPKSKTRKRHCFFSCSVIKHWNNLKSNEINVRTLNSFKNNVLRYLRREKIL
jgi:hypothetical protein